MQKITPFLWFDDNAEEAVSFYTSEPEKSRRVVKALLGMKKIDMEILKRASG
jgi:predicted 3-demethylubiquinone-9 3-methyltransferase (glyoxalase superfamily)